MNELVNKEIVRNATNTKRKNYKDYHIRFLNRFLFDR